MPFVSVKFLTVATGGGATTIGVTFFTGDFCGDFCGDDVADPGDFS